MTQTTCIYDQKEEKFVWDVDLSEFVCVDPIGLVIGGTESTYQ